MKRTDLVPYPDCRACANRRSALIAEAGIPYPDVPVLCDKHVVIEMRKLGGDEELIAATLTMLDLIGPVDEE